MFGGFVDEMDLFEARFVVRRVATSEHRLHRSIAGATSQEAKAGRVSLNHVDPNVFFLSSNPTEAFR